ncbi:hypothetical protein GCM10023331_16140 [Algivirga pacifica]|uniref:DUF4271 domain-containing protein n=2 Tax=Algivirga pacifica TaxID=1162670 RepID=A0ABP9D669_9BACT
MLLAFGQTMGQEQKQNIIHSLNDDWLVYDNSSEGFVPFIEEIHEGVMNHYLFFDASPYRKYKLRLRFAGESSVFVNNKLFYKSPVKNSEVLLLGLDSLLEAEGKGTLLLTFYNEKSTKEHPRAAIVKRALDKPLVEQFEASYFEANQRREGMLGHHILLVDVLILLLLALISRGSGASLGSANLMKISNVVFRGRGDVDKLTTLQVGGFLLSFGLVGGMILYLLLGNEEVLTEVDLYTFGKAYLSYFSMAVILMTAWLLLIAILGKTYNLKQVTSIHIQAFIDISQVFLVVVLLIAGIWVFKSTLITVKVFTGILFFFLLLKTILVFIVTSRQISFRNKYLFSYFCATELLPTLLVMKILL